MGMSILINHLFSRPATCGVYILLIGMLGLSLPVYGQAQPQLSTAQTREVIQETSHYVAQSLLDGYGRTHGIYDMLKGRRIAEAPFMYAGQTMHAFTDAHRIIPNPQLPSLARKSGQWWLSKMQLETPGSTGFPQGIKRRVLSFDEVGRGLSGMVAMWEMTQDSAYYKATSALGNWLLTNMCDLEQGVCYDYANARTGEVLDIESPVWKRQRKSVALEDIAHPHVEGSPFMAMYQLTGEERYKEAHLILCRKLLETQGRDGLWVRIPSAENPLPLRRDPLLNLWYTDALLDAYVLSNETEFMNAARRVFVEFRKSQDEYGTLLLNKENEDRKKQMDIEGAGVAYMGLLMFRLQELGDMHYWREIDRCAYWLYLHRYSEKHSDVNVRGGIMDLHWEPSTDGYRLTQDALGTLMAIRFLVRYYEAMVEQEEAEK